MRELDSKSLIRKSKKNKDEKLGHECSTVICSVLYVLIHNFLSSVSSHHAKDPLEHCGRPNFHKHLRISTETYENANIRP